VFLLNNLYYIQKTVQHSDLWSLIPSQAQFLHEFEKAIGEQRDIYKSSWKRAIEFLQLEGGQPAAVGALTKPNKKSIQEKFKGFNSELEMLYEMQKQFYIPDSELRKLVRNDTASLLLEPYVKFYNMYANLPFSKNKSKYVRYPVETLKAMLGVLFDGTASQSQVASGGSSSSFARK